jgi:hypothetical protein
MDALLQSTGALIALLGTLAVALLGFYQWRKQQENTKRAMAFEVHRKAYQDLWQKLEDINITLRGDQRTNPEIYSLIRGFNTWFLQNSLHFEDSDQQLFNDYVLALDRLRSAIYCSADDDVASAWTRTWASMPETVDASIRAASDEAKRLRQIIKTRVQRVASVV